MQADLFTIPDFSQEGILVATRRMHVLHAYLTEVRNRVQRTNWTMLFDFCGHCICVQKICPWRDIRLADELLCWRLRAGISLGRPSVAEPDAQQLNDFQRRGRMLKHTD
jgi:hypothetical protein